MFGYLGDRESHETSHDSFYYFSIAKDLNWGLEGNFDIKADLFGLNKRAKWLQKLCYHGAEFKIGPSFCGAHSHLRLLVNHVAQLDEFFDLLCIFLHHIQSLDHLWPLKVCLFIAKMVRIFAKELYRAFEQLVKRTGRVEAPSSIVVQQVCDISHVNEVAYIVVEENVEDLDLEDFLLRRTIFILASPAIRFFDGEASHCAQSLIFFF